MPASAIVVTHQSADFIGDTLEALIDDPSGPAEVIVVDSGSTDDTVAVVSEFPVRLAPLADNVGFGAAVNQGASLATQPTLVMLNHDVVPDEGWLPPLLAALGDPDVGAAMPTIELADRPGHFNTSGGAVTVSGLAWITDLGTAIPGDEPEIRPVPFPSGAAFAIDATTWQRLGGFDERFFLYHEDTDLGWRLRLLGLTAVRATSSRVSHSYDFTRNPGKYRLLERNRWLMVLANYRLSTLVMLAPILALHELGVLWMAWRDGWLRAKLGSWRDLLSSSPFGRRREVQRSRVVGDAEIMETMMGSLRTMYMPEIREPRGLGIVDRVTAGYTRLVLPLVRLVDRVTNRR